MAHGNATPTCGGRRCERGNPGDSKRTARFALGGVAGFRRHLYPNHAGADGGSNAGRSGAATPDMDRHRRPIAGSVGGNPGLFAARGLLFKEIAQAEHTSDLMARKDTVGTLGLQGHHYYRPLK
jgi:hypothetical protein